MFSLTHSVGTVMSLHSLPRQLHQNQTIHNICTIKPKLVLAIKPKLVMTNGVWPKRYMTS